MPEISWIRKASNGPGVIPAHAEPKPEKALTREVKETPAPTKPKTTRKRGR